jgi:hypothetical protein
MNNGDDTAYYLSLGFRVIAIEANPELVANAKFRFLREIMAGRLTLASVGIAEEEGQFPFWICEKNLALVHSIVITRRGRTHPRTKSRYHQYDLRAY